MLHARHHEEPVKDSICFSLERGVGIVGEKLAHLFVKGDGISGCYRRITPAVVLDELAAVCSKAAKVRVPRIENGSCLLVSEPQFTAKVRRVPVPVRILVYGLREKAVGKSRVESGRGVREPQAAGVSLGTRLIARINLLPAGGVLRAGINLLEGVELRLRQALCILCSVAEKNGRIEMARARILNRAVLDAV